VNTLQPQHPHDCDRCIFLGHYYDGAQYDLYFCDQNGFDIPTVVARYGSEGHHYLAGLGCVTPNSALEAAQEMAGRRGLL